MNGVIPISNVVSISVNITPSGVAGYNVNNIGLFTTDPFISNDAGDLYRIYSAAQDVADDFGSDTETYQQALEVFAQQLNILNGGGQLIIIPIAQGAIQTVAVGVGGTGYAVGDVLNIVQTDSIGGTATVTTVSSGVVTGITLSNPGIEYSNASGLATTGGTGTGATITISAVAQETLAQAIDRATSYIYFNGILSTAYGANTTWANLATQVQAYGNKILALPSATLADLTGAFLNIRNASEYATRCLYRTTSALDARLYAAAYLSRLLSTNFSGSNTTQTMNLKQLIGVTPDPGLNDTLLHLCEVAGVDVYANYGGSFPGVISNGANKYADEVINLIWLSTSLQVAGFNALASVGTKIPQTEAGISILKTAYRLVLSQAVTNQYVAPGAWTSSETFGNQQDFLDNITQYGFYIYSQPVALQSANDRAARKAPLIQIACKEAGAVQSTNVIVSINP